MFFFLLLYTVLSFPFGVISGVKFKNSMDITAERNSNVVLEFSTDKSCHVDSIMFINVTDAATPGVYCNFLYMNGTCVNPYRSPNCYCEPVTSDYRIIISFTGLHGETWRLASELANSSAMITETVTISAKPYGKLCCLCHSFTSLRTNEQ